MDVFEAVVRRRSIRRFKDKSVPYDVLEKCVDAGRLAPAARNRQLIEYIIVDDEQLLPAVFDSITLWAGQPKTRESPPPGNPPRAYIIMLVNSTLEAEFGATRRVTTYDVGMSAENVILVALEQGVGACPILMFRESELKRILNIADTHDVALVLALGYPDESPVTEVSSGTVGYWVDNQGVRHVPKRKLEDITHHNKFLLHIPCGS